MADDKKGLKAEYSTDGVHLNETGHKVMAGVIRHLPSLWEIINLLRYVTLHKLHLNILYLK